MKEDPGFLRTLVTGLVVLTLAIGLAFIAIGLAPILVGRGICKILQISNTEVVGEWVVGCVTFVGCGIAYMCGMIYYDEKKEKRRE